MEDAVAKRQVDLVFTQPANYVFLSYRYDLSSPLVTLYNLEAGVPSRTFGGVIAVQAARDDLQKLADIAGKKIATASAHSFGGYLMAAYELQQAGVSLPKGRNLIETGMPHDKAIEMVLAGSVDAAFVRSGLIEEMTREGKIRSGQLRVINLQSNLAVPFAVSTALYPEWPLAASSTVDEDLANEIASVLLSMPHEGKVAKEIGIHGFNFPMNYYQVIEVLKTLRQPPFDTAPVFTAGDIGKKYFWLLFFVGVLLAIVLLLFIMLLRYNQRLRILRQRAEEGDRRLRQFSKQLPGMIYQYHLRTDGTSHYPYVSDAVQKLYDLTAEALNEDAKNLFKKIHPDDIEQFHERVRRSAETMEEWRGEYRILFSDGSVHWRLASATPQRLGDGSILWHGYAHDIDERKQVEERNELLIAALEASANAIAITDLTGKIEWVNSAFCALTGYVREELIGHNPRVLKSGLHEEVFYKEMWRTLMGGKPWRGEIVNRRKDGSLSEEELIIAPVIDGNGEIHHFIGVKQDISERKRMEEELRIQATTDVLTGLPNRRYFLSRAEGELSRIKRGKAGVATVIMLDIDLFKNVNDTYGHGIGDMVLKDLAKIISNTLRRSDSPGRLGGEEFVVLLPETTAERGLLFAERLREKLTNSSVVTDAGIINYTASFGITAMTDADVSVSEVLERADEALYRAKRNGRNRVETA
jgi:diguanylate cyclase (GGDEF)-like protein/PAS domain S-box-containing protein